MPVTDKRFQIALKQIRVASYNLHNIANDTGDDRCRRANQVLAHLANALEFGAPYVVASVAEWFDEANQKEAS